VDIHLGRGNGIRILAQILDPLLALPGLALALVQGGSRRNVIAREASALLLLEPGQVAAANALVQQTLDQVREQLGSFDPGVSAQLLPSPDRPASVLTAEEARRIVDLLCVLPHGVQAMSPEIPDLVQTSSNLAVLSCQDGSCEISLSHRSALASGKAQAGQVAGTIARQFGFQVTHSGGYPGWKPQPDSELLRLAQAACSQVSGSPAALRAIHAGLECGILGDKHPGLQMLSFGPKILDAHSPQERLSIASVAQFWAVLTTLLQQI
jgi:dipeptidase D